jgi:hypothetical protein
MKFLLEYSLFDNIGDFNPGKPPIEEINIGDRIILKNMVDDPDPIPDDEEGIVDYVDVRSKTISVSWENGRTLNVLHDVDDFVIIPNS